MTRQILNMLFGRELRRETARYLQDLSSAAVRASREQAAAAVNSLESRNGFNVTLGKTTWGQDVNVSLSELLSAHGLVTGGSGAGKTRFGLLILKALIEQLPANQTFGFGLIDPKNELFWGCLYLLVQRLAQLDQHDPDAASRLRKRVVIIDFSSADPVSPYQLLSLPPEVDIGFFADSRADLLSDLLPSNDNLSVNGSTVLRRAVRLLIEGNLPITRINDLLYDDDFRDGLVTKSRDEILRNYFARQFPSVPKQTIAALSRRLESLFSSQGVRLALGASTAPDLRALQDAGNIVLVGCFGQSMSRHVRQLLQTLVLGDLRQAVFARRETDRHFLWFLDESQNFFVNERSRDNMRDLLTLSRSFGSFFVSFTQNIVTAVHDPRLLADLHTNAKWSFSMRGQPTDCTFLKGALPISGRRPRPRSNPFEDAGFYSASEERGLELEAISSLPDRTGYFWPRSRSAEAVKITTQELTLPESAEIQRAIAPLLNDATIGGRVSRRFYEEEAKRRDKPAKPESREKATASLVDAYKRVRGGT